MTVQLSNDELGVLVPAFLQCDKQGRIIGFGPSLLSHIGHAAIGRPISEFFSVQLDDRLKNRELTKQMRSVKVKGKGKALGLELRGPVIYRESRLIMYLGHVPVRPKDIDRVKLGFEDFPPTDSSMDFLFATKLYQGLLNEARTMATDLRKEKFAAEAANHSKTRFLATMSHELRTPLNGILGMAEVIGADGLSVRQKEMINIIKVSGETLLTVLNDVLDMSKIEDGHILIAPEESDFRMTLERITKLHRATAEKKNLTYSTTIQPDFPSLLQIDAQRAGQCISNLISNAVKFTHKGFVRTHVSSVETPQNHIITVSVSDSGIGLNTEATEALFEPFTQADNSTTREYGGTGLGLSISRRIMRLMDGDITVESEQGKGSTFQARFSAGKVLSHSDTAIDSATARVA